MVRAERTKLEWTGLYVDRKLWEARNAQDFVRGVKDDQTVPDARPLPPPLFVGPIFTTLARVANVGDTFIYLESTFGFTAGGPLGVMLANGEVFNTTQVGAPAADGVTIANALPLGAPVGYQVQAYEAAGP